MPAKGTGVPHYRGIQRILYIIYSIIGSTMNVIVVEKYKIIVRNRTAQLHPLLS